MKKSIFNAGLVLLAAAVLVSACNNKTETPKALVTVTVNDFTITQEDFPAAQHAPQRAAVAPADYNGVGAMTLAFYNSEGTEVYKTTQVKSDNTTYTTFGTFTASLPIGNYTMVAVGYAYYDGDVFVLTGPTEAGFTSERPRETFSATQDVTVTNTTPLNLNVTLSRISAKLNIVSTDNRPASATKIRTTVSKGGKDFNPTTGLALSDAGFTQTNNPSSAVGATISVSSFPFLYADEETMTVTIEVLDADDNVLATKVVNNVPFKRNRSTKLQGALFSTSASTASFQLDTGWLTEETVNF